MLVVFVRRSGEESDVEAVHPTELGASRDAGGIDVAMRKDGPFVSIENVPDTRGMREVVARAFETPSVKRFRRARPWLLLGLFPVITLLDLERQLISLGTVGVAGRLVLDLAVLAFMIFEIARPLPRHPRTWAFASLGVAARYAYMIAAMHGHALPLFFLGAGLALSAAVLAFATMPSPRRLARDVRAVLRVSESKKTEPPANIAAPLAAALALPALLAVARALGAGLVTTAVIFIAAGTALSFVSPARSKSRTSPTWREQLDAAAFGLTAAISLVRLVHYTTLALGEILHFAPPGAAETSHDQQASTSWAALLALVAVFVVPIVEERLYRGALQRALRTRTSSTKAIGAASVVFGVAHLGVYRATIHQAVLLGVAFGATYEEAGIVSAIAAHALYNATQLF